MQPLDQALFERARGGDRAAREEIFTANTGLIWAFAKKYGGLLEKEDLFQLGAIGLLKAIDRFDLSYGVVFSTFAVPHILGEIRRHLRDNALVKVDRRLRELAFLAARTRREAVAKTGEEPALSEIAEDLGVPVDVLCEAMEAVSSVLYLEDIPGYGEAPAAAVEHAARGAETLDLKQALEGLESDARTVVEGRFFLGKTQTEIARELGISQAHVSRLEKKALLSLRASLSPKASGF
jgi:RNA polymerase sporulation-specific sigma factor